MMVLQSLLCRGVTTQSMAVARQARNQPVPSAKYPERTAAILRGERWQNLRQQSGMRYRRRHLQDRGGHTLYPMQIMPGWRRRWQRGLRVLR